MKEADLLVDVMEKCIIRIVIHVSWLGEKVGRETVYKTYPLGTVLVRI